MQKKFEKLPGLSNVSGKYTKKCPTDAYLRHVAGRRYSNTISPNPGSSFPSSFYSTDKPVPHQPNYRTQSSEANDLPYTDGFSKEGFVTEQRGGNPSTQYTQQQSDVTSPCRSTTQVSILTECKSSSDNAPTRPFENIRRVKKPSDIVKSSSSGSVVNLGHKPTGIILATPSIAQESERRVGRLFNTGEKAHYTTKVGVSRQHGPSTPYPTRQTYGHSTTQPHSGNFAVHSSSSAYPVEHSKAVPVSTIDSVAANSRPSMLVRPFSLPIHSSSSVPYTATESGDCIHPSRRYPCTLAKKCSFSGPSGTSYRPSPVCSFGIQHTTFTRPTPSNANNSTQDEAPPRSLPQSRSMPAAALVLPPSCLPRFTRNPQSTELPSVAWCAPNSRSMNLPHCQHCTPGLQAFSRTSDRGRPYGTRGRNSSWSSEHFITSGSTSVGTMPGPQYTQCALEQYLSDLIAEECFLPAEVEQPDNAAEEWEPRQAFGDTSSEPGNLNRFGSSNVLEPLRFLEQRIKKALQGVHRDDMHHSTSLTSELQARCNRDQNSSLTTRRCFSPIATPTHVSSNRTMDTETVRASVVRSEASDRSSATIDSDRLDYRSHYQRNNMLDQFSEDELRYLLKAVQDLLVLRSRSSTVASSGPHHLDSHEYGHHSQPDAGLKGGYPCDVPAVGSSRTSSRSSSSVRTGRALEHTVSNEDRVGLTCSVTSTGTEFDPSTADLMHKRLPLGFQHFKRYLDNKFGPDHPQHRGESVAHSAVSESGSQHLLHQSAAQSPQIASIKPNLHGVLGLAHSSARNSTSPHVPTDATATGSDYNYCWPDGEHASSSRFLNTHDAATVSDSVPDQCYLDSAPSLQTGHTTQMPAPSQAYAHRVITTSPNALYWDSDTQATESFSMHAYEDSDGTLPQQFDISQSVIPNTAYVPFHQRSYCSTPEAPESIPSRCFDPAVHSRWPHCYWWPQFATDLGAQYTYGLSNTTQRAPPTATEYITYPQEFCRCGTGYYASGYHSPWPHSPHVAAATSFGSHLRYPDSFRFFSTAQPSSETPTSLVQVAHGTAVPPSGFMENQPFSYGITADGGTQGYSPWDYTDRVSNVSFVYPGLLRTHYALPTSPTYDPALFNSAGFWNSRFPYHHYSAVSPSYYFRMPRSGSAGAGFGCSMDPAIGITNRQPSTGDRISRGRSVGPDPNGFGQTQPPQPLPRSSYRYLATRCTVASQHTTGGRISSNLSPPIIQEFSGALPSIGRSMSNSLSANDLASYRSKTGLEMRSTKSSFELAPDLPCEPNLALVHCSDFYARIAALVELDNNLQLAVPSGWSERRSSLGRSYYACDQTKQAIWHHPTFGLHVPLGWERVDSYHHGVYYQHLLIPHCQRYHPNLWISGPLKDPSVERENFFSDLRYLQSSMRHEVKIDCPEVENYKNTCLAEEESAFINFLKQLDVESMVEVIRTLDQLFYKELHTIIVCFEQERMRIVSTMFAMQQAEHIIPVTDDS